MPTHVTHLLIAKKYIEKNTGLTSEIKNIQEFIDANILPDLAPDKAKSHYGIRTEKTDIVKRNREKVNPAKFKLSHDLSDEKNIGYFMHLYVDYNYYNILLRDYFEKCKFEQSRKDMFQVTLRDCDYIQKKYGVSNSDSTHNIELDKQLTNWINSHYEKYGKDYIFTYPYTTEELEKFIEKMASVKI